MGYSTACCQSQINMSIWHNWHIKTYFISLIWFPLIHSFSARRKRHSAVVICCFVLFCFDLIEIDQIRILRWCFLVKSTSCYKLFEIARLTTAEGNTPGAEEAIFTKQLVLLCPTPTAAACTAARWCQARRRRRAPRLRSAGGPALDFVPQPWS